MTRDGARAKGVDGGGDLQITERKHKARDRRGNTEAEDTHECRKMKAHTADIDPSAIVYAAKTAKALGMKVIALTGETPCRLDELSDVTVHVGDKETYRVQELHLPVYHWLCAKIEDYFFEV